MNLLNDKYLVALDSSMINDIARDYFNKDVDKNKKANDIINSLYNGGGVLVITWHHLEELLAHKNDHIVNCSIALIRNLPEVASIKNGGVDFTGNIRDIDIEEINNILKYKNSDLKSIIQKTKKDIFSFSSGEKFLELFLLYQPFLREKVLRDLDKKREIVSISRAKSLNIGNNKLSDLKTGKINSPEEAKLRLQYMEKQLASEIKVKGDKKIESADTSAKDFLSSIYNDMAKFMNSPSPSFEELFLKNQNITNAEFEKLKNMEEYDLLVIFKERIKGITKEFSTLDKKKALEIEENSSPTWLLWKELYKCRIKAERVSGSDINDAFLSGLCLYVDLTIVDKRTHEYLSQIKRKNKLIKPIIGNFKKLSNYSNILEYLPK